ncbi:hypothetical protein CSUI_006828, partial [Cystoisospora suis]
MLSVSPCLSSASSVRPDTMMDVNRASVNHQQNEGTRLRQLSHHTEDSANGFPYQRQFEDMNRRRASLPQNPLHLNLPVSSSSSAVSSSPYQPSRFQSARSNSFSAPGAQPQQLSSSPSSSYLAEVVASAAERAAQAAWLAAQAASMAVNLEHHQGSGGDGDGGQGAPGRTINQHANDEDMIVDEESYQGGCVEARTPPGFLSRYSSSTSMPLETTTTSLHPNHSTLYKPTPQNLSYPPNTRLVSKSSSVGGGGLSSSASMINVKTRMVPPQNRVGSQTCLQNANTIETALILHPGVERNGRAISRTTSAMPALCCGGDVGLQTDFIPRNQRMQEKRNVNRIVTAEASCLGRRNTSMMQSDETTRSSSRRDSGSHSSESTTTTTTVASSSSSSATSGVCTALVPLGGGAPSSSSGGGAGRGGVYTPEIIISKSEHVIIGRHSPSTENGAPNTIIHRHHSESIYTASHNPSRLTSYNEGGNLTDRSNHASSVFRTLGVARQVTADSSHSRLTSRMSVGGFLETSQSLAGGGFDLAEPPHYLHPTDVVRDFTTEEPDDEESEGDDGSASSFFPMKLKKRFSSSRSRQRHAHPFKRFSSDTTTGVSNSDEEGGKKLQKLTEGILLPSPPSADSLRRLRENPKKNFNSKTFLSSNSHSNLSSSSGGVKHLFRSSDSSEGKKGLSASRKSFLNRADEEEEYFSSTTSSSSSSILFPRKKSSVYEKKKSFGEIAVDTAKAALCTPPNENFSKSIPIPSRRQRTEEDDEDEVIDDSYAYLDARSHSSSSTMFQRPTRDSLKRQRVDRDEDHNDDEEEE